MVIQLTAEQEAQLLKIASLAGRSAEEMASEVLSLALARRLEFAAAVERGQDAADRGEFVEPDEVWAGIESMLRA